jgi:hypothetical protein
MRALSRASDTMKERLLNLFIALALLLCVGLVVVWVVGFFVGWSAFYGRGYDPSNSRWMFRVVVVHEGVCFRAIHSHRVHPAYRGGNVGYYTTTWRREGENVYEVERSYSHGVTPLVLWGAASGDDYVDRSGTIGERSRVYHLIVAPLLLALLTAVPPALWLARAARGKRRARRGLCPACGYDLRATPGLCPECGRMGAVPG